MARLTTTSYLILGMLASRDWSAYELAEQIGKGVTEVWPRAGRQLYNAPKQLLADGLITATKVATGRRERTVYSLTPSGREALREWLSTDARPPALEFEGMVRVLLADQGELADLRNTLRRTAEHARRERERFEGHRSYAAATGGGTYPERQHVFGLANAFMVGHFTHLEQWATRALAEVEQWTDTLPPD